MRNKTYSLSTADERKYLSSGEKQTITFPVSDVETWIGVFESGHRISHAEVVSDFCCLSVAGMNITFHCFVEGASEEEVGEYIAEPRYIDGRIVNLSVLQNYGIGQGYDDVHSHGPRPPHDSSFLSLGQTAWRWCCSHLWKKTELISYNMLDII